MVENKQDICDALLELFKLTRDYNNIASLNYVQGEEVVIVKYKSGSELSINVNMDSGAGMIKDVIENISRW